MDPTVPQPPPMIPTPIQQPLAPIPPVPNPIPVENPVQQNYGIAPSVTNEIPKKSSKKWVILGSSLFLVLIGIGIFVFFRIKSRNPVVQDNSSNQYTYTPIVVPTDTPKPVTLAPPGTSDFSLQYWRTSRATVAEAQAIDKEVGSIFGEIPIPQDLKFVHEEVYKGIPIKWTAGQPISDGRLAWIKAAIDELPPFFAVDHPITGLISATPDELQIPVTSRGGLIMYAAYASGLNIFLTNNILIDKSGYVPLKQVEMTHTLFHEWTHVVQYYEALQTFSEAFLKIPGNATIALSLAPFAKDFAKTVGWDFGEDQYADNTLPTLKKDTESQKTSDYGKEYYYEDEAETMASFMTCQTSNYSQARIQWAEKITNTSASSYCH